MPIARTAVSATTGSAASASATPAGAAVDPRSKCRLPAIPERDAAPRQHVFRLSQTDERRERRAEHKAASRIFVTVAELGKDEAPVVVVHADEREAGAVLEVVAALADETIDRERQNPQRRALKDAHVHHADACAQAELGNDAVLVVEAVEYGGATGFD